MHALRASSWVELKLFLREPLTVMFTLALPLLFLFVLGGVFGNQPDPAYYRGAGPLDFYVPGYVALVWAAVGLLALPVHLARYREDGVLRRLRASSATRTVVLGSQFLVALAVSLAGGLLVVVAAALTFDVHAPDSPAGFVLAWILCAALFGSIGLLFASLGSSRTALFAGLGAFFVMMMLSGAGPPPEVLTGVMRDVRLTLPLTYVIRLMQDAWLGLPWGVGDIAAVLGFTAAALVATRLLFRWE
jgi:ABC-2 type transport system permease protein